MYLFWFLVFATYCDNYSSLSIEITGPNGRSLTIWRILCFATTLVAFLFKLSFTAADSPELLNTKVLGLLTRVTEIIPLVSQARLAFVGIIVLLAFVGQRHYMRRTLSRGRSTNSYQCFARTPTDQATASTGALHYIFTLFLLTQSRATNIPIYLLLRTQRSILGLMPLSCVEVTMTLILFQYTSFFAFGGSNAISSIDLSSAYNGVSSYNAGVVGVLTFLTNWAGPMFWISASHTVHSHQARNDKVKHDSVVTIHTSLSLLSVMVACTVLRAHLFIWTVFSPKLLYSMAWTLGHHLLVNVLTGYLLSYL